MAQPLDHRFEQTLGELNAAREAMERAWQLVDDLWNDNPIHVARPVLMDLGLRFKVGPGCGVNPPLPNGKEALDCWLQREIPDGEKVADAITGENLKYTLQHLDHWLALAVRCFEGLQFPASESTE